MQTDDADAAVVSRLAPRLQVLHKQNGGDWAGTIRDALALLRQTHQVDPRDGSGFGRAAAETSDTPREDD
jgi:hypothetical protein